MEPESPKEIPVEFGGRILIARPKFSQFKIWAETGLGSIELNNPVVCSGTTTGSDIEGLELFCFSKSVKEELEAYLEICAEVTNILALETWFSEACQLLGLDQGCYRLVLNPGGTVGDWISKIMEKDEALEVGSYGIYPGEGWIGVIAFPHSLIGKS